MKWSCCCQDEVVSECSWYVEDSKEEKTSKKERKSICTREQSKSRSLSLTEYIPSRASISCVWWQQRVLSRAYGWVRYLACILCGVCVHSRYGSRYLTVYERGLYNTRRNLAKKTVCFGVEEGHQILCIGQLSKPPSCHVLCIRCVCHSMKNGFEKIVNK